MDEAVIDASEIAEELTGEDGMEYAIEEDGDYGIDGQEDREYGIDGQEDAIDDGMEYAMDGQIDEIVDDSVQGFFQHKDPIYSVRSKNTLCISGGGNDKSFLWDISTGQLVATLGEHSDSVIAVGFNHDSTLIASAGMDGSLFIFNSAGALLVTLQGPAEITFIDWHPKGNVILAGGADGTIWMWAVPSGTFMKMFLGHSDGITAIQFTPDGKNIVSASLDGSLIVWDPKTAKAVNRWDASDGRFHQEGVTCLGVSKDSTIIVSGSSDGTVLVLHAVNGKILESFEKHDQSIESIVFANHSNLVAVGGVDGRINVWDYSTIKKRFSVLLQEAVTKLMWTPDDLKLVAASMDATVSVWDARTADNIKIYQGHQAGILDFDINGNIIVTGSDDGTCLCFGLE